MGSCSAGFSADPEWERCIASGLSSGEGLIWQVRDQIVKMEAVKDSGRVVGYQEVITDHLRTSG